MKKIYYHASKNNNINSLEPISTCHEENGKKCVYVTNNYAYALLYIRDMDINIVTARVENDDIITYEEQFKNQFKTLYKNQSGYLYFCKDNNNILPSHKKGIEYSLNTINIKAKKYIKNVYKELKKQINQGLITIKKYKDLDPIWKSNLYNHIANKIIDNNFYSNNIKLAKFYKKYYKVAWKIAKSRMKRS